MGSYGIGVTRAVAVIAEQHHDELGLVLAGARSPRPTSTSSPPARSEQIERGARARRRARGGRAVDVLVDDRPASRVGVKFKDAELLGMPTIVVVGRGLVDGVVEVRDRASRGPRRGAAGRGGRPLRAGDHRTVRGVDPVYSLRPLTFVRRRAWALAHAFRS